MSNDMFDSKNKTPDPETLLPHEDESREYRATRGRRTGGNRVARLLFVPNAGTHRRRLPMSDLHMQDGAFDGTDIILEFSSQTVVVRGRNLTLVDDGIAEGWVASLEAFDPRRRDRPADANAPFIERIDFYPKREPKQGDRPPARTKPRLVKTDETV